MTEIIFLKCEGIKLAFHSQFRNEREFTGFTLYSDIDQSFSLIFAN